MAKKLELLVIHCTATPEGRVVLSKEIRKWHLIDRGWSRLGYSDMVHLSGELENLVPFNFDELVDDDEMTWGVAGKNSIARHIVYVGGLDKTGKFAKDTRTEAQKRTLETYVKYTLLRHPGIKVAGHYHFAAKACPSFVVEDWLSEIGIPEENIYKFIK